MSSGAAELDRTRQLEDAALGDVNVQVRTSSLTLSEPVEPTIPKLGRGSASSALAITPENTGNMFPHPNGRQGGELKISSADGTIDVNPRARNSSRPSEN